MFLTDLLNLTKKCFHEKVTPDMDFGYCPDCGKLIKNEWYIVRCGCCGVKMKAVVKNGEIYPQNHYCSNCGSDEYIAEKIPKINFIDVHYAALIKSEVEEESKERFTTQCWQERTSVQPKLLIQYQ